MESLQDWCANSVVNHFTTVRILFRCIFRLHSAVASGHRGIIYNRIGSIQNKIIPEGTYFLVPWFQHVYKEDIRPQPRPMISLTGTRGWIVFLA